MSTNGLNEPRRAAEGYRPETVGPGGGGTPPAGRQASTHVRTLPVLPAPAAGTQAEAGVRFDPAQKRLALVYSPWAFMSSGAIGLSILKQCAARLGYRTDIHYLTVKFAERIGFDLYDNISRNTVLSAEWFFSNLLFGERGTGTLRNGWDELAQTEDGQKLRDELVRLTGGSEEFCRELADKVVPEFFDEMLEQIPWGEYDLIGFSVTYAQSLAALLLSKRIKERYPDKVIVLGGSSVDDEMGFEILKACDWLDYVAHGEAEHTFPRLLHNIFSGQRFEPIPGVSFRHGGQLTAGYQTARPVEDVSECPPPDYSDYIREVRRAGLDRRYKIRLQFESARGCWWGAKHHCTFCGLNRNIIRFRQKSPERVYGEIMSIARENRCFNLYAVDFIMDMDYFNSLLPELAAAGLDLSIFYEIKANLTREQVRQLAAAGIKTIQPGIESFNTEILNLMRKGVTGIQNVQLIKWCLEEGIDVGYNILYSFPGERPEQYELYRDLLPALFHLQPPAAVNPVLFERFSPYHFERESFGVKLTPNPYYQFLYPPQSVDFDRLAYFFDGEWDRAGADPEAYIRPAKQLHARWKELQAQHNVAFFYEKGPGFLILYDNRPRAADEDPALRRIVLNEVQSQVYLFCDQNRSFRSIVKMLQSAHPDAPDEAAIGRLLDKFVQNRLMMREGDRYLSLAVRHTLAYQAIISTTQRTSPAQATEGAGM